MASSFDSSKPRSKGSSRSRIAQLAANPATRASLADKYLSPAQLKQRQLNQRLNSPITPGSSVTNRQLAHQAQNAVQVQYGDAQAADTQAVRDAQQREVNVAAWYDDYIKAQQALQAQIANNNQAGYQALLGLQGAAGGMATGVEGTATQATAAMGQQARQNALGQFVAYQQQLATDSNNRAATQAGTVAPGQKIVAQTQASQGTKKAQDALALLQKQMGAANQQYRTDTIASEAKNVLANQALGLNQQKAATSAAQTQERINETTRHNKASEAQQAASQKASLSARGAQINKYGYSNSAWQAMTPAQRQQIMASQKNSAKSSKSPFINQSTANAGIAQLAPLKNLANKAKTGAAFVDGHGKQPKLSRADAAKKIQENTTGLKATELLSAALDAAYDGHLSAETVRRLMAAGYKPSQVASALGVPTPAQLRKTSMLMNGPGR